MKKLDIFPKFTLSNNTLNPNKEKFPNIEGIYSYKNYLITVYKNNGIKTVTIENSNKNKLEFDDLENIATYFIGLNYKLKKNNTIEEIKDDNN